MQSVCEAAGCKLVLVAVEGPTAEEAVRWRHEWVLRPQALQQLLCLLLSGYRNQATNGTNIQCQRAQTHTETHQPNHIRTTNMPSAATSSPALMWAEPRSSLMKTVPAGGMVPSSLLARHSSDALMKVDIACWCQSAIHHSPVSRSPVLVTAAHNN